MSLLRSVAPFVMAELRTNGAVLVPLRLFIGVGWLRAGVAKAVDADWYDGTALAAFISERLPQVTQTFPWYSWLLEETFLPFAAPLGVIVMVGQVLVGLGVLTGTLTTAALAAGLLMNVNFVLAGSPDPNAFYLVIQVTLLFAGTGAILGGDAWLSRRLRSPLLVAGAPSSGHPNTGHRRRLVALATVCLALALSCAPAVATLQPENVMRDPAMILAVTFVLAGMSAAISLARLPHRAPPAEVSAATRVRTGSGRIPPQTPGRTRPRERTPAHGTIASAARNPTSTFPGARARPRGDL